jgi:response regulator RpfG family c-di-GMP phosphodiesterase
MESVMGKEVLIVCSGSEEKKRLKILFNVTDLEVCECSTDYEALDLVKKRDFSLVIISPFGQRITGLKLKKNIQLLKPNIEVILLNNFKNIRSSEDILHHGATDYIIDLEDLRQFLIRLTQPDKPKKIEEIETQGLKEFFFNLTDLLLSILAVDDKYFSGNNHTVMKLSRKIAKKMDLDREIVDAVTLGSLLRDLGKIGLDQDMLNVNRKLTDDEFLSIKEHSQTSLKLLKRLNLPWRVDQVILHHHEAYDGNGYPYGLKGREISVGARILAVVDSYVAMTTDRPYRKALDMNTALQDIHQKAGTRYDPEVVEIFLQIIPEDWKRNAEKKERLLVVEDEQFMQALIKLHMVNEGFEVITAQNGAEAIKCIKQNKPDLIISDVMMPLMDGLTLCRMISKDPNLKDVPVLLLSANKSTENRVQGLKLGAIDYITKPFDLEELSLKINTILKREKRIRKEPDESRGIKGRLEDMSFPEIVQVLNLGLKTAQVDIQFEPEGMHGELYFSRGEVNFVSTEKHEGEEAFFEMLKWNEGSFKIRHGIQPPSVNVSKSTMGLLMDGMKIIDEENRDRTLEPSK